MYLQNKHDQSRYILLVSLNMELSVCLCSSVDLIDSIDPGRSSRTKLGRTSPGDDHMMKLMKWISMTTRTTKMI